MALVRCYRRIITEQLGAAVDFAQYHKSSVRCFQPYIPKVISLLSLMLFK